LLDLMGGHLETHFLFVEIGKAVQDIERDNPQFLEPERRVRQSRNHLDLAVVVREHQMNKTADAAARQQTK
jgi:hypothetical protein